jgi:hypothetical protein
MTNECRVKDSSLEMLPPSLNHNCQNDSDSSALRSIAGIARWCVGAHEESTRIITSASLNKTQIATILALKVSNFPLASYHGKVTEKGFQIAIGHLWFHNPWGPVLTGQIEENSDGCVIKARFDISPLTKSFTGLWLVGSICFAIPLLIRSASPTWGSVDFEACFLPVMGICLARFGKFIGEADEEKLCAFLESIQKSAVGILPAE